MDSVQKIYRFRLPDAAQASERAPSKSRTIGARAGLESFPVHNRNNLWRTLLGETPHHLPFPRPRSGVPETETRKVDLEKKRLTDDEGDLRRLLPETKRAAAAAYR